MGWRESTWGDEISLEYGKGIRGYGEKKSGKFRVFGSNGPVGWTDDFLAPGPGVILGRKGAYRGVRYSSDPFFVIDTAYYVRPKKDLHMRWLYYAVLHHKLGEIDDGSPIPSTTRAAVYVRDLCVPTPHEQGAIAAVLGALDDKIELNWRMNETLQAMARAIFKDWFVDFGPTRAKMEGRAPYLEPSLWALFPDSLDDDGKPEGWRYSTVHKEFNLTMGQSPPGTTYNYHGEGVPFYQGRTDFGFRFPSRRMYCTEPKRIATADDTLISVRAPDVSTRAIFGDEIDVYDISRAVEDGATVPIYYESRLARIELPEDEKPIIDAEVEELTEDEALYAQEKFKAQWATVERLVGSEDRLHLIAADLVEHFERRLEAMDGKAMVVCMSRRICVDLYDTIIALRPDWHSNDDSEGAVKIVMTGSAGDPPEWQPHIGNKSRRDKLALRAKNAKDPLKLVIVRDMWLTGFDAPSMHTMYVDKPMKGHGLMQAIARVNRVFKDKPAGLVVDYIGIAQSLKNALGQYSKSDQQQAGIDEREAVGAMVRAYEVVKAMFHGFDYTTGLGGSPHERLVVLASAIEWILTRQHEDAAREPTDEGKKLANRRYQDGVLNLSKAFALSAGSDEAKAVAMEVGFFQAVRAALTQTAATGGKSSADRDFAIQQILNRAVVSTEIVDILKAAGLQTPDISILSDQFLAEVQQMSKKNLALEALRKLLAGEIHAKTRTNIVETKRFSERLEEAIARYHSNAITTAEVIQELINLAHDVRDALNRGEDEGLTAEEIAFYDALAENNSAVEMMGNDSLKVIAHELLVSLKGSVTVDWSHRESARAKMRVLVKRILRKYGFPPDLQEGAVQTVLRQAEALSASWVA